MDSFEHEQLAVVISAAVTSMCEEVTGVTRTLQPAFREARGGFPGSVWRIESRLQNLEGF